jgi:Chaperone of endosialidase
MNANLKILLITGLFVLSFAERVVEAGPVGPLTTFTAGTQAKASEVNGNFSAVKTAVDDNATRVGTLEGVNAASRLTTLEGVSAASRITTLETVVTPAGNIVLVPSTQAAGNILKGTAPFVHNYGLQNTFIGVNAGNFTMTGEGNTASGSNALSSNTAGILNTASGGNALSSNTIGMRNTAAGASALHSNTTGDGNTAVGDSALQTNTTGALNTGIGRNALISNTIGFSNTAIGGDALSGNTTGLLNTASGASALTSNTTGQSNTAMGAYALNFNSTGSFNIAIGNRAGYNLTGGNNNIAIGNEALGTESDTIRIGTANGVNGSHSRAFIAGIRGVTTGIVDAIPVVVDSAGQLGTLSSSRRVKDDIADMGGASSALMKLRPVTFYYKTDRNPEGRTLQYGLVAEEVAAVAPELVARSADGQIETVYYQFLAPMLLNEYQKQQRTIRAQAEQIAALEQDCRMQTARIEALEKQSLEIAELKAYVARMASLSQIVSVKGFQ